MIVPPEWWFSLPVELETYQGAGAYGETYAAAVTVLGHVTGGQTVHWASQGNDVVASEVVILPNPCRLADGSGTVNPADVLTPQTRVTFDGLVSLVSAVEVHRSPGSGTVLAAIGQLAQ